MKAELTVKFAAYSPEQKDAIVQYARSRGFAHTSDFIRHAVAEYIRRRPPKQDMPDLRVFYEQ